MANYESYDQDQTYLIRFNKEENFPVGTYARFLSDLIDTHIDISPFAAKRKNDAHGKPAKHAKMMLKIIYYSFSTGTFSYRQIAEKTISDNTTYIFLTGYTKVSYSTISRFISAYQKEISEAFTRIFYVTKNMGYVTNKLVAIDGTKIKANANKSFTGNYAQFEKKKRTYQKMINNLFERGKRLDEKMEKKKIGNAEYLREKKNIKRLNKKYNNSVQRIDDFLKDCTEKEKKTKVNLIDRESVLVEKDNRYFQGYNCQTAVNEHGIIVMNDVINSASDRDQCQQMVRRTLEQFGKEEKKKKIYFLLDKGYHNSKDIGELMREKINVLIPPRTKKTLKEAGKVTGDQCEFKKVSETEVQVTCPGRLTATCKKLTQEQNQKVYKFYFYKNQCKGCMYYTRCSGLVKKEKKFAIKKEVIDNMKELNKLEKKMNDLNIKDIYYKRFAISEQTYGQIKGKKNFQEFLVRGLDRVKTIWNIVCTSFNIKKIYNLQCG